jgi:hypothetical protein
MRNGMLGLALVVALLVAAAVPVWAHHSFAAEFDSTKPITLRGFVTKVEWTNPHVWFYINVKDESGRVTNWGAEMGPPHGLQGRGWQRTTMKIGDEVIVNATRARNGSFRVNARNVVMAATGKQYGAASSEGGNDVD